jgi:hypothetical protein
MFLASMALLTVAGGLALAWVAYSVWEVIYNVFFHPLAKSKFPGPWWAGASFLPELYFDFIKGGQYFKEVEKMHERYGNPIICLRVLTLTALRSDRANHT